MKNFIIIVFAIGMAGLWACSSSKKTFESGDYYSSVMQSISKLRKSPNNKKSREVLSQAYPMAVDFYLTHFQEQGFYIYNGFLGIYFLLFVHFILRSLPA